MARSRSKSKTSRREKYASFTDLAEETEEDADLPKDEAGRRKIKRQYGELLGIRIEKLRGHVLNRERINKTIEGIYFICAVCLKVCHSLDDGIAEDAANQNNLCGSCAKTRARAEAAAGKEAQRPARPPRRSAAAPRRKRAAAG
ncbi:MAG: hypothetical protein ACREQI_00765 [Candidatus Binataceae bacterium]